MHCGHQGCPLLTQLSTKFLCVCRAAGEGLSKLYKLPECLDVLAVLHLHQLYLMRQAWVLHGHGVTDLVVTLSLWEGGKEAEGG